MRDSSATAIGILNDLLMYEKVESNLLSIEMEELDLYSVVRAVIKPFNIQARSCGVDLRGDLQTLQGAYANIDSSKFSQVIRNLLSNALKFTPVGGSVHISAEYLHAPFTELVASTPISPLNGLHPLDTANLDTTRSRVLESSRVSSNIGGSVFLTRSSTIGVSHTNSPHVSSIKGSVSLDNLNKAMPPPYMADERLATSWEGPECGIASRIADGSSSRTSPQRSVNSSRKVEQPTPRALTFLNSSASAARRGSPHSSHKDRHLAVPSVVGAHAYSHPVDSSKTLGTVSSNASTSSHLPNVDLGGVQGLRQEPTRSFMRINVKDSGFGISKVSSVLCFSLATIYT